MIGRRKGAIAAATAATGLFVVGWLAIAGGLPTGIARPIADLTQGAAPTPTAPTNSGLPLPKGEVSPPASPRTDTSTVPLQRAPSRASHEEIEHRERERHHDDDDD